MSLRADVAVVGAGIVGLAFAWEAARRGKRVVVFERSLLPSGASVRNFGMIWPIGQPTGLWHCRAMLSRDRWLELGEHTRIWVNPCGSVHAVYHADEWQVLQEFVALDRESVYQCELFDRSEAVKRFPNLNSEGLQGVLYSPTELAVDPRQAIEQLSFFVADRYGVSFQLKTQVNNVEMPTVETSRGDRWHVDTCLICSGADLITLFPEIWARSGIQQCKLQMMRTRPQPDGWKLGPHLAGGLTLAHYASFQNCPSVGQVKARIQADMQDYMRYGIHVMAAQNHLGEVIIGDSHEYGPVNAISPFDKAEIDELILGYLRHMLRLPDWTIAERWHGVYVKHPTETCFMATPQSGCVVVASPGGAGMTLSFGLASDWWDEHEAGMPTSSL